MLQPGLNPGSQVVHCVARDLQPERDAAILDHLGGVGVAVGVANLARLPGRVRLDDLVAGGQDGHPRPAVDGDVGAAQRRQHADLRWPENGPALQDHLAGPNVLAGGADVLVVGVTLEDQDLVAVTLHFFKGHYYLGAGRDGRAGHNAYRRAGWDRPVHDIAGGQVGDDAQAARGVGPGAAGVLAVQGVAVHGGVGQGRDVHLGDYLLSQKPVERVQDGYLLWL